MAKDITDARRDTFYRILPDLIEADPTKNGRAYAYTREECDDLIRDYADPKLGQLQPGVARPISGTDRYQLTAGNRRRQAMIFFNEDRVGSGEPPMLFKFVVSGVSEREAYRQNVRENAGRKALTPIDVATIIQREREMYGATDDEIAELLGGVSRAYISQHVKLNQLPEDVRRRIHYGDIGSSASFALADLTEADMRTVLIDAGKGADTGKIKGASVEKAIRKTVPEKAKSRRIKDVREVFQMVIDSSDSAGLPKSQIELAAGVLKFIDGKITERQVFNLLDKVCRS